MKKIKLFSIIALMFMTLIGCEKDQFEPITNLKGGEEMVTTRANATVPFKANFNNTIDSDYTFIDAAGNLNEYITGIGKATHLGKSTIEGPTTVYEVFQIPLENPLLFNDPPFDQDGYFDVTAADGSTFIVDYSGTTSPCSVEEGCFFAGDGTYDIREGSGTKRFLGTSGTGGYSYVATMDEDGQVTSVFEMNGTITKP